MATVDVIANVGDTLISLLRAAFAPAAPGEDVPIVDPSNVVTAEPGEFSKYNNQLNRAVTIFLYHVSITSEVRNAPRRTLDGGKTTRPLLPLTLRYLITPWSRDARSSAMIAGRIMQKLYDKAELGPSDLQGDSWAQGDSVQVIFDPLPVQDHYNIWDPTELPYRLSLTYLVRVIGLEPAVQVSEAPVVTATLKGAP
ncbi:MAG TPA: DUF4255 domain-containing protein [Polyangia bacterium]|nr:DUF4255 domain-containing protein [Polyangia bacterium]